MASDKSLNEKNLAALGAERLAALVLELATGDAAAKRRLRLELASQTGGGDVAAEIRKRIATIAKARSHVDWRKIRKLAQDLDLQRTTIMTHLAHAMPGEAMDLLWRLMHLAPSIHSRCDSSNGVIGAVFDLVLNDLGTVATAARPAPDTLASQVFEAMCANDYGQFDRLISLMAVPLGKDGLDMLKARFEVLAATPPARPDPKDRRVIAISLSGPMYEDEFEARAHERLVRSALTEIADAMGDADGYAAHFTPTERANPAIAAQIAQRLLAAGRGQDAMAALDMAKDSFSNGGIWPDWQRVRIDVLDALDRSDEAQCARWDLFARDLNAQYLRAHLKRLPDFDDEEAENRAFAHVRKHGDFHKALAFALDWPAPALAAELVLARHDELDGDHYALLTPAADALEHGHPLATTLILRAMIDFALDRARSTRYGHAACHLHTCALLAKRIDAWGDHVGHDAYVARLRQVHGRKTAFWSA